MFLYRASSFEERQLQSTSLLQSRQSQLRDIETSRRRELQTKFVRRYGRPSKRMLRSVCQMSREYWVTRPQKGFIRPTGSSATGLQSGIDSLAKAIGGGNLEQQGSAMFLS